MLYNCTPHKAYESLLYKTYDINVDYVVKGSYDINKIFIIHYKYSNYFNWYFYLSVKYIEV